MNKPEINSKWLLLSEETNALDYLEKVYFYIQQTEKSAIAWKWVVLALHSALYGFAICALQGTNPARVTYQTQKGVEKLIGFDEALKRCQNPRWMIQYLHSKCLQLSKEEKASIKLLKRNLRDSFQHFIPRGWLIEIHGMPQMVIDCLNVIRFLTIESGNCFYKASLEKKIKSLVYQSKRILKKSELYKEAVLSQEIS
ncbi:hypothetical protein ACFL5M_05450 [Candidatus Neomarinimicrobiota bacterium]